MESLARFQDLIVDVPPTEGIKYAGSKLKLIPYILQLARQVNAKTILDGFAGTTRVAQAFAKRGYRVLCNDIVPWSEVFASCYLLNTRKAEAYNELMHHLNAVPPLDGWFTERTRSQGG
jgi:adenine-specific DNA-methyltransferase